MSTTIKTGWLKDNNGEKFAPKTLASQVQMSDGTLFEDKIQTDLNIMKDDILSNVSIEVDTSLSPTSTNPVQNKVLNEEFEAVSAGMNALGEAINTKLNVSAADSTYETKTDAQTKLDETKSYIDSVVGGKSNVGHNHDDRYYTETEIDTKLVDINTSITNITSGTTVVKNAEHANTADSATTATSAITLATAKTINGVSFDGSSNITIPANFGVVTSGTSTAYTATVEGITSLTAGVSFTMIPHVVSTSTAPTLNVNNLGAKAIRRRVSNAVGATSAGYNASWLTEDKPIRVEFDGAYWIADLPKPSAADMSGTLKVANGGTGVTSVAADSFLVGNGTSAMVAKTPAEVATMILPTITTADNGAFLRVVDGTWVAAQMDSAEGVSF